MNERKTAAGRLRFDFNLYAGEVARLRPCRQHEGDAPGPVDLHVAARLHDFLAVMPVLETELAASARVDLDARNRARGGREQPLRRDRGIDPGVENSLRGRIKTLRQADFDEGGRVHKG